MQNILRVGGSPSGPEIRDALEALFRSGKTEAYFGVAPSGRIQGVVGDPSRLVESIRRISRDEIRAGAEPHLEILDIHAKAVLRVRYPL
jgi:hypothetical protein